jgi:hypothetical protein
MHFYRALNENCVLHNAPAMISKKLHAFLLFRGHRLVYHSAAGIEISLSGVLRGRS